MWRTSSTRENLHHRCKASTTTRRGRDDGLENRAAWKWARRLGKGAHFAPASNGSRRRRKNRDVDDGKKRACSCERLCVSYKDLYYFCKHQRRSDVQTIPHPCREVYDSLDAGQNSARLKASQSGPRGPSRDQKPGVAECPRRAREGRGGHFY